MENMTKRELMAAIQLEVQKVEDDPKKEEYLRDRLEDLLLNYINDKDISQEFMGALGLS